MRLKPLLFSVLALMPASQNQAIDTLVSDELRRTDEYADQLENYLSDLLVDGYAARSKDTWNRDYTSEAAFIASVAPNEEHAFFRCWLTEFTDHDAVSLICPRPLLIQTGKKDGIAWWPMVVEEYEIARTHYVKLGIGERIALDLQDVGHEAHLESGQRFLTRWLVEENIDMPRN